MKNIYMSFRYDVNIKTDRKIESDEDIKKIRHIYESMVKFLLTNNFGSDGEVSDFFIAIDTEDE
jgi:hypothetical protein